MLLFEYSENCENLGSKKTGLGTGFLSVLF